MKRGFIIAETDSDKGFTLVELSIVLVIIGLLIGGILAAQSMISTAKIQGVVRQLQQYDVAVANFQTKYGQLPGDSNLFGSGGNNDGQISGFLEGGKFFSDLSQGVGLKNTDGTDFQAFQTCFTNVTNANWPNLNIDHANLTGYPVSALSVRYTNLYSLPSKTLLSV